MHQSYLQQRHTFAKLNSTCMNMFYVEGNTIHDIWWFSWFFLNPLHFCRQIVFSALPCVIVWKRYIVIFKPIVKAEAFSLQDLVGMKWIQLIQSEMLTDSALSLVGAILSFPKWIPFNNLNPLLHLLSLWSQSLNLVIQWIDKPETVGSNPIGTLSDILLLELFISTQVSLRC